MKKLRETKKRMSITKQIALIISLLVALTFTAVIVMNMTFLPAYYMRQKQKGMMETFDLINQASINEQLQDDDFQLQLENICATQNVMLLVMDEDGGVLISSENKIEKMERDLLDMMSDASEMNVQISTDNYKLFQRNDSRLNSDYMVLLGKLDGGEMIILRTAVESIHESSSISNHFLLIIGTIATVFSLILGLIFSRRITRPIQQLTDISSRMVDLDFEAKYIPGAWKQKRNRALTPVFSGKRENPEEEPKKERGNEVDLLGNHINRLSETLEETISELKTANAELQRDIDKKTQIDEMRKEFLSNVSHELKTPLALIQGYAEGLQEFVNDDPESRDYYCEVIIDEADKMNHMVKKLLTLNQLEFGNDQVVMDRFELTELVHGVVSSTRILTDQKQITVEEQEREPIFVWGDEFKLEEVITNYMSNAINHCEGDNRIRISYALQEDKVRVSVFNTGKPIPEEDIDNIWIKFYKVDKARTRAYGGSGIGLSIVKAIMDSHQQKCGVINHEDGVEFWMELSTK